LRSVAFTISALALDFRLSRKLKKIFIFPSPLLASHVHTLRPILTGEAEDFCGELQAMPAPHPDWSSRTLSPVHSWMGYSGAAGIISVIEWAATVGSAVSCNFDQNMTERS